MNIQTVPSASSIEYCKLVAEYMFAAFRHQLSISQGASTFNTPLPEVPDEIDEGLAVEADDLVHYLVKAFCDPGEWCILCHKVVI